MSSLKAFFNIAYTSAEPPKKLQGAARAEYIARRKFYNLTSDYNYFSYTLKGEKVMKNATAEDYFTRSNTNEGLFNLKGPMNKEQVSALKAKLKDTQSTIWHGVVSFDEETSIGFNCQEKASHFMRQTFGALIERTNLRMENIEFFASMHDDTDNRHIHFAFFEKEPLHRYSSGELGYTRAGKLPQKAIDNYLVSANMHLSEHADEYYTARDRAMSRLNEIRKDRRGIRLSAGQDGRQLNFAINNLISRLPATGRLSYNSANMSELRPEIDRIAGLLISSDPQASASHKQVLTQFARIEREVTELAQNGRLAYSDGRRLSRDELAGIMGHQPEFNEKMDVKFVDMDNVDYLSRLQADYRARLGNVVLGMCKDMKKDTIERRCASRYASVNERNRKIAAKNRRKGRGKALGSIIRLLDSVSHGERADFIATVQENEYAIQRSKVMESKIAR